MTVSPVTNLAVKYYYSPVHPFFHMYVYVVKDLCIPTNIQTSLCTIAWTSLICDIPQILKLG